MDRKALSRTLAIMEGVLENISLILHIEMQRRDRNLRQANRNMNIEIMRNAHANQNNQNRRNNNAPNQQD